MRGIKHVLTERFYTWEDAVTLAQTDPEIDLTGEGPAFRPAAYLEEETSSDSASSNNSEAMADQHQVPVR